MVDREAAVGLAVLPAQAVVREQAELVARVTSGIQRMDQAAAVVVAEATAIQPRMAEMADCTVAVADRAASPLVQHSEAALLVMVLRESW